MSDQQRPEQPPTKEQPAPAPPPWPTLGADWKDAPEPPPPGVQEAPRPTGEREAPFPEWEQPPAPWAQQSPQRPDANVSNAEARNWAVIAHLSALVGLITALPVFGWAGPLLVWLFKRHDHPYIAEQAREALNFNLSMALYFIAGGAGALLLALLAVFTMGPPLGVIAFLAFPVLGILWILWMVFTIVAAVKASNGDAYRYPLTMRMVR